MSDINLNLYKTFYEVAKAESLTDASEKLFITIPAVSKNIRKLEEQLNEELFIRENNGVSLTSAGQSLYTYVEQGLKIFDRGEKLVTNNENLNTVKLRIGSPSHVSNYYLMHCIKNAREDYPDMELKLCGSTNGKGLIKLLEENKIDFAIDATHLNINKPNIIIEEIVKIQNIFISKKPLKIEELKELEKLKYILPFESTATYKELTQSLMDKGIFIKSSTEMDITESRVGAVKEGLGIGYVMKQAVKEELKKGELYEVEIPLELPTSQINLIYIDGRLTKADKKFINEYLKSK